MKLTDKIIKGLAAPESGNRITYDDDVKGLGVRVTAAGAKSFILTYWVSGRQRRYTLGRYPEWPLATARSEAKRLKLELRANGKDPLARIEGERTAPTDGEPCERYIEEHASKKRPDLQVDAERIFRIFVLPRLLTRGLRKSPTPIATGFTARSQSAGPSTGRTESLRSESRHSISASGGAGVSTTHAGGLSAIRRGSALAT